MRWATFDCFGTLIDWRHGIASSAELLWPGRGQDVLDAYHRHETAVQCEKPDRRYRDVLAETLRRSAAELNLDLIPTTPRCSPPPSRIGRCSPTRARR